LQAFVNTWVYNPPSDYLINMRIAPNIHGSPVYWETSDPTRSYIYAWSEKDFLKAFSLDRHTLAIAPALSGPVASREDSMPGGILSLSASGTTAHTGIVWAVVEQPTGACTSADIPPEQAQHGVCPPPGINTCDALCYTVPGVLYAFDAENLQSVLFQEAIPRYSKMTPPTIANGKVFLATSNSEVRVYGLH
jgi:hypothetical protein